MPKLPDFRTIIGKSKPNVLETLLEGAADSLVEVNQATMTQQYNLLAFPRLSLGSNHTCPLS